MAATYGKVRDVLKAAVEFHQRLEDFYGRLAEYEDRDQERLPMLLEYMSRHEQGFEQMLAGYDEPEAKKLLETWMQYEPDERTLEVPQAETLRPDMSVEDVVEIALQLDDELVRFYAQAARMARNPAVRDLFDKLTQHAEDEKEKISLNASMIKDL
ncbi:MAG: hypothetical protein JW993_02405 [Sedimentisphaerales bacterium]|nr:hypothetical protein [Sedimentisphaerales bacterium]